MANQIKLAQGYSAVIDEVYQAVSASAVLNSDRGLAKAGASAKEIVIPKVSVTGLGDYDRNSGYTQGSVTLEYETVTFDYDRGCAIVVDAMDAAETDAVNAFAVAESELQRTQVAPESDAYTFAKLAGSDGVAVVTADYADALAVLDGLDAAMGAMDEAQVSGGRILFITPTLARKVRAVTGRTGADVPGAFTDAWLGAVCAMCDRAGGVDRAGEVAERLGRPCALRALRDGRVAQQRQGGRHS